jgi:hypothetical protein
MMRAAAAGAMLMAACGAAHAQRVSKVDGNRLLAMCTTKSAGECDAYLSGVSDTIEAEGRARAPACIPTAVTGNQMRDVVIKYIHDNPQSRELKAGLLTIKALSAAFPCRN